MAETVASNEAPRTDSGSSRNQETEEQREAKRLKQIRRNLDNAVAEATADTVDAAEAQIRESGLPPEEVTQYERRLHSSIAEEIRSNAELALERADITTIGAETRRALANCPTQEPYGTVRVRIQELHDELEERMARRARNCRNTGLFFLAATCAAGIAGLLIYVAGIAKLPIYPVLSLALLAYAGWKLCTIPARMLRAQHHIPIEERHRLAQEPTTHSARTHGERAKTSLILCLVALSAWLFGAPWAVVTALMAHPLYACLRFAGEPALARVKNLDPRAQLAGFQEAFHPNRMLPGEKWLVAVLIAILAAVHYY